MTDLPPLTFATARIEHEFHELPRRNALLYQILDESAEKAVEAWGWLPTIIDIFRTQAEEAATDAASTLGAGRRPGTRSPHAFWLAADLRTRGVPEEAVRGLDRWINARWIYDPARPEMQVSDIRPHGTGPHMHLQAKPGMTRLRGEGS